MFLLVLIIFAYALAPLIGVIGKRSSPIIAIAPLSLFIAFCIHLPEIAAGNVLMETQSWIPSLGIAAAFKLDGLSLTFVLLITGIGTAVFLYASAYLHGEPRLVRFYTVLTLFMASMLGAVTMLTGSVLAMRETDLKRVLAYSTIVSLGTLTMLIGIPSEVAAIAVVTFLIVHALYKACLFLVVGIIDHETGMDL